VDVGIPEVDDTLRLGIGSRFIFSFENDVKWGGYSMGFNVYSNDGATWAWANVGGLGTTGAIKVLAGSRQDPPGTVWDLGGFQLNEVDMNNTTPDLFLIGGVAMMAGMQPGPLQAMVTADFVPGGTAGEIAHICIDSLFVPPAGNFVWVDALGGAHTPDVVWPVGDRCFPVTDARNFCPAWAAGNPTSMSTSHCTPGNVVLNVTDVEQNPADFALNALNGGGGTATVTKLSGTSCRVSYAPVAGDVGLAISIVVDVWDAYNPQGGCETFTVNVTVTNNPPTIDCGLAYNPVGKGNPLVKTDIVGDDDDACDVLEFTLVSETPAFLNGPGTVDLATGDYQILTDLADVATSPHVVCVKVSDGIDETECCFDVDVLPVEPWELQIEKTHATLQGHFVDVAITLNKGSEAMGGFDFLIGYDASALAFTEAALGDYFVNCGWEYFTYRFNWNGNCGNACPSGLLRVVGLAETNNGASHPDMACIAAGVGQTLVTLTFFVSNDRTLECMYVPIRFYWMDCGDNTISVASGDTLAINRYIVDFSTGDDIADHLYGFPGYVGAPDDPCLDGDKVKPVRFIDFMNGGIDIVCGDSIDARGDINVNGVKNEIADAVMFTNYFINGLSAFGSHIEASIAASDVNADGIALSVADLVYQIRVIIGDAQPYDKPMPGASVALDAQGGTVRYDAPVNIGAALLTFQVNGEIGAPVLGAGAANMDIKSAREGNELRVLIYNIGSNYIAAGENVLVTIPGDVTLTGAEVASYQGYGVDALVRNLPTEFAVKNFPNPFNPKTTIALNMPVASDWSVKIYNVAGQLVKEFSGYAEAGVQNVIWDGTDMSNNVVASGIYFYKAEASKFSATKKMVLMK